MKKFLLNSFIVCISVMIGIGLGELVLGVMGINRYQTWLEMDSKGFIQNQANMKAWGQTFDKPIYYTINEHRNRITSLDSAKSNAKYRVLLLGDSFTFGLYLQDTLTIAHQLNKMSADSMLFVNGGVGGSGTGDQFYHLKQNLAEETFDEVVLMLNTDDVDRMISKNLFLIKDDDLVESQRWKPTSIYYAFNKKTWHSWLEKNSRLYAVFSKYLWKTWFFYDDYTIVSNKRIFEWPKTEQLEIDSDYSTKAWIELIQKMNEYCRFKQTHFSIVTTGFPVDSLVSPRTAKVYNQLGFISEETQITINDLRIELVKASGNNISRFQLKPDLHPNRLGAKEIAKQILEQDFSKKMNKTLDSL